VPVNMPPAIAVATAAAKRRRLEEALAITAPRRWLHLSRSTYAAYDHEVAQAEVVVVSATDAASSLRHVLRSLTAKSVAVLRELAALAARRSDGAVAFDELLAVARDRFHATTAAALNGHLVEPLDHRLVVRDGNTLRLGVSPASLEGALSVASSAATAAAR